MLSIASKSPSDVLELFINKDIDINSKDEQGFTALNFSLIVKSPLYVIKELIKKGADINAKDKNNMTPLHHAIGSNSSIDVIETLIEKGADLNAKDKLDLTPLHTAILCNSPYETVKLLIDSGCNLCAKSKKGLTPLHFAIEAQSPIDIINETSRKGFAINVKNNCGLAPLSFAILLKSPLYIIKELLKKELNINSKDNNGKTPLHLALENKFSLETIKELIQKGADTNAKDIYGRTPLHYAIKENSPIEIIETLINNSSDVKAIDNFKVTVLHIAVFLKSEPKIIELLIKRGADVNAKDCFTLGPVHFAYLDGRYNGILKLLIKYGAKLDDNLVSDDIHQYFGYCLLLSLKLYKSSCFSSELKVRLTRAIKRLSKQILLFPKFKNKSMIDDVNCSDLMDRNLSFLTYNNYKIFVYEIYLTYRNCSKNKLKLCEITKFNKLSLTTTLKNGLPLFLVNFPKSFAEEIKKFYDPNETIKLTRSVIRKLIRKKDIYKCNTSKLRRYKVLKGLCFTPKEFLTENGNNFLHYACIAKVSEKIFSSKLGQELKKIRNKNGWTPYFQAIFKAQLNLCKDLEYQNCFVQKDYFGNFAHFYSKN